MNHVEETGRWPRELTKAYVALVPKDDTLEEPMPTDYRPISVLSAIYRLWSKVRFEEALDWQERWCPDEMWGCRKKRGAETMAMSIALDLEAAAYGGGAHVGGVSYDFKKAFDLIPIDTMLRVLQARGLHDRILVPLRAMYSDLRRVFKLGGTVGEWFKAYNGIIQGDALSMLALNSIVSCILETSGAHAAKGTAERSCADDISTVAVAQEPEAVRQEIRRFHSVVRAFTGAGGGEVNLKKCFTLGDDCVRGVIGDEVCHFKQFKIVGGSFAVRAHADAETELERQRLSKWKLTVGRIRHVPRSWRDRARMMQATQ